MVVAERLNAEAQGRRGEARREAQRLGGYDNFERFEKIVALCQFYKIDSGFQVGFFDDNFCSGKVFNYPYFFADAVKNNKSAIAQWFAEFQGSDS